MPRPDVGSPWSPDDLREAREQYVALRAAGLGRAQAVRRIAAALKRTPASVDGALVCHFPLLMQKGRIHVREDRGAAAAHPLQH
jgi:hypothetical protein